MADLFVLREVFVDETYSDILPLLREEELRIVDVGGNLGSFSIWLHSKKGVQDGFCFEPEPDSFRLLSFNLEMNGCGYIKALPFAVGGEERVIQLSLKQDSPGGTNIYNSNQNASGKSHIVKVISFQNWLQQTEGKFDLLKLDCEGAEWEILRRTDRNQFTRFRVLVAEVHGDPQEGSSVDIFRELAENLGFKTVRWDGKFHGLYVGIREILINE